MDKIHLDPNHDRRTSMSGRALLVALIIACAPTLWAQQPATPANSRSVDGVLHFLIDDDRMAPSELTVPEGRYRFVVHNAFTSSEIALQMDDARGQALQNSGVRERLSKGLLVVNLKEGEHKLFVPERPKWSCTLTVTKHKGR